MNVTSLPREQQVKWLKQRGWEPHPEMKNVFIDPDTRETCFISVALTKATAACRLDSDYKLNVECPPAKLKP